MNVCVYICVCVYKSIVASPLVVLCLLCCCCYFVVAYTIRVASLDSEADVQ